MADFIENPAYNSKLTTDIGWNGAEAPPRFFMTHFSGTRNYKFRVTIASQIRTRAWLQSPL